MTIRHFLKRNFFQILLVGIILPSGDNEILSQNESIQIVASYFGHVGRDYIEWDCTNFNQKKRINAKWSSSDYGAGIGVLKMVVQNKYVGLGYEYQRNFISGYDMELSKRIPEHHLVFSYSSETTKNETSNWTGIRRLYIGLTRMRAYEIDHAMIGYTAPYVYDTKWKGVLFGFDIGASTNFGDSDIRIQITGSFRYSRTTLLDLWRVNDHKSLSAYSFMQIPSFGLNLTFIYAKGFGKNRSSENNPISN